MPRLPPRDCALYCAVQVQTQVEQIDEKHNVSGKFAAVALTASAKVQEVNTK